MECLKKIDWKLLDLQRAALRRSIEGDIENIEDKKLLEGLENFLDALSDEKYYQQEKTKKPFQKITINQR